MSDGYSRDRDRPGHNVNQGVTNHVARWLKVPIAMSDGTLVDRTKGSGPAVVELQEKLNAMEAKPRLATDGQLGPKTQAAMKALMGETPAPCSYGSVSGAFSVALFLMRTFELSTLTTLSSHSR